VEKANKKWNSEIVINYYLDGVFSDKSKTPNPTKNIKYIGNCFRGTEPVGIIADFRVYPNPL